MIFDKFFRCPVCCPQTYGAQKNLGHITVVLGFFIYCLFSKQPYEELDQVGYWCLFNVLKAKDFQEFLGNSEAFDFYCEYAKFDFSRFDVSWLLNLYPHTLEQIAKNAKVKERVRVAIATTLDGEAIAPSDSQRLQSILVKHFC